MLEDFTMEKKPSSRSVLAPSKGCGTEAKKAPDTTSNNGKQYPRQSRRREQPGPKWDQNKKSFSQRQNKSGYYDKRPKQKGQFYGCGKANTQVVDELTEQFGLVATSPNVGSKKQSLNHLLNFHYAPRGEHFVTSNYRHAYSNVGGGRHYFNNNSTKWLMSTHKHKYNKEQFLQANCQFVVKSDGDYSAFMGDPDILVDWDKIEQICVFSCEEVNCPICLSTPTAGKITRCGHVFCWPCMLHYLALSDKPWRKCPICYESVHLNDLKSVQVLLRANHLIGEKITFRLMKRERGSLIASPVTQYDARMAHGLLPVNEDKLDLIYSKLLTANIEQVSAIIDQEKKELAAYISENEGCPELCFIERAILLLNDRKEALIKSVQESIKSELAEGTVESSENSITLPSGHVVKSKSAEDININKLESVNYFDGNIITDHHASDLTCEQLNNQDIRTDNAISKTPSCPALSSDIKSPDIEPFENILVSPDIEDSFVIDGFDGYGEVAASAIEESGFDYEEQGIESDVTGIGSDSAETITGRCRYISASSTSEGEDCLTGQLTTITAEDLEITSVHTNASGGVSKHFYFYQAEDGQQIFLHAVNVRMLEMTYGSLENSPPLISGTILEKESGSMTEELRKRLRYLQHLPVTCQFEVAEIDLKPPIITDDTVELFKDQLDLRRRRREKRARDEKRREKKVVEQVLKQYGRGPTPRLRIESLQHFPECGSDLASSPPAIGFPSTITVDNNAYAEHQSQTSSRASSPISLISTSPSSSSTSMSFAQMLRDGKSNGGGWHKKTPRPTETVKQPQNDSDNESNPIAAPHYRQSFSEAIAAAFEQAALIHDKEDETEGNGKKKKKRKQKVLLFSTGMACNTK